MGFTRLTNLKEAERFASLDKISAVLKCVISIIILLLFFSPLNINVFRVRSQIFSGAGLSLTPSTRLRL